jgi:hypothetical protein
MIKSWVTCAILGCVVGVSGETITICPNGSCAFTDVQEAIDYSKDGDVLELAAGTYPIAATLNVYGKAIVLSGTFSRDGTPLSMLDGQGAVRVLECATNETNDTVFEHLVFINGSASYGAGVLCENSAPTFVNCIVKECVSTSDGAGVCNIHASPTMIYCVMESNATTAGFGGGMANFVGSTPELVECVWYGNQASLGGGGLYNSTSEPVLMWCRFETNATPRGGGAVLNDQSNPTFEVCSFIANTAGTDGGGMFNAISCSPTIRECLFEENTANDRGGGVCNDRCSPLIHACEFKRNRAENGSGGAIANEGDPNWVCRVVITECVFEDNAASARGGAVFSSRTECLPTVRECAFQGNSAPYGSSLANENGAFVHLQSCVFDECCCVEPLTTAIDFGGNNSLYICQGCKGDVNCDGQVDGSDLSRVLSAWGPSTGRYDLNADGVVNGGDVGFLFVSWGSCL